MAQIRLACGRIGRNPSKSKQRRNPPTELTRLIESTKSKGKVKEKCWEQSNLSKPAQFIHHSFGFLVWLFLSDSDLCFLGRRAPLLSFLLAGRT